MKKLNFTNKNKGQILLLVSISMVVLVALVALAIDVGIAYSIRAKLNSAVDGAAIAAGRAVKQGSTDPVRISNAQAAASRFFTVNYPAGFMGSNLAPATPTTTATHNSDGSWTITVTGRAITPTYFARAVGWNSMTVRAEAETTVRDLDLILVLDCSGSLGSPPSPVGTFNQLKAAAINFVNRFADGAGGDRIGVVTFASGAVLDVPIDKTATRGFNKTTVTNAINALTVGGSTASGEALRVAREELNAVPQSVRSSLRVIVFFSDGAPNDVAGYFSAGSNTVLGTLYSETIANTTCGAATGRADRTWLHNRRNSPLNGNNNGCTITYLPDRDWTNTVNLRGHRALREQGASGRIWNDKCNVNMAARNMVENVANDARSGTGNNAMTVYTLGLGARLNSLEINFCGYLNDEYGANILKRLANTSDADTHNSSQPTGLYVYAANASDLDAAFQTIANQILRLSK